MMKSATRLTFHHGRSRADRGDHRGEVTLSVLKSTRADNFSCNSKEKERKNGKLHGLFVSFVFVNMASCWRKKKKRWISAGYIPSEIGESEWMFRMEGKVDEIALRWLGAPL